MKIYRVCTTSQENEEVEKIINPLNPGWRNSYTGFWTSSLEDAVEIMRDRHEYAAYTGGGGLSWSVIVETDIENVVVDPDHDKYKEANSPNYDRNELFVSKILDDSKIRIMKDY